MRHPVAQLSENAFSAVSLDYRHRSDSWRCEKSKQELGWLPAIEFRELIELTTNQPKRVADTNY